MSKADELLNQLSDDTVSTYMANPENEPHIVIDDNRFITVPDELKRIAVQFDHNIETVTFDCPRYWDGIDLSVMKIYINYMRSDGQRGQYWAQNVVIDEADSNIMHFEWTLTNFATQVNGKLSFLVCVSTADEEGNELHHWHSELNEDLIVSKGLECEETILNDYPDIITQLLVRMDVVEEISITADEVEVKAQRAEEASATAVEAMEKTELARVAFDNGTEFIFDGGDAEGNVDIDGDGVPEYNGFDITFAIDNEMSDVSDNPVKNSVIKAYTDESLSRAMAYTDNAAAGVMSHTDTEIAAAKEYTDAKIAALEAYTDLEIASVQSDIDANHSDIIAVGAKVDAVADYIIERGVDGMWTYEKWASGKSVCWGEVLEDDVLVSNIWQNGWYYYDVQKNMYPQNLFIEKPLCQVSLSSTELTTLYSIVPQSIGDSEYTPGVRLLAVQETEVRTQGIGYYAIGRWK